MDDGGIIETAMDFQSPRFLADLWSTGERGRAAILSGNTMFVLKIVICATLVAFVYGMLILLFVH